LYRLVKLLSALLALVALGPARAQDSSGAYAVGGIAVDVTAKTTNEARMEAYRTAERQAWPLLWARLSGQPAGAAPRLADGTIDGMVAGFEIQGEHFSTTRYIAKLGVVFDRGRASSYFTTGIGATRSPPMLLLPVLIDGGVRVIYQAKTPWLAAWQRFRDAVTPIDYIEAQGTPADNVLLTGYQPHRDDRPLWRNILSRFKAADVLIAEVKLDHDYPGGPVSATFIARHGPDATELGRFELRSVGGDGLNAMFDEGVRRTDAIYAEALRDGRLRSEPDLTLALEPLGAIGSDIGTMTEAAPSGGTDADVATPSARSWNELETVLKGTPTVAGVSLTSLSLGGTSHIVIRHTDSVDMLAYQLDQKRLRLAPSGSGLLLRRKVAGDPVIAPPVTAADLAKAEAVAEPDAAPLPGMPPTSTSAGRAATSLPPAAPPTVPAPEPRRQPRAPARPPKAAVVDPGGPVDLLPPGGPR
jgi:hypothetical protein